MRKFTVVFAIPFCGSWQHCVLVSKGWKHMQSHYIIFKFECSCFLQHIDFDLPSFVIYHINDMFNYYNNLF